MVPFPLIKLSRLQQAASTLISSRLSSVLYNPILLSCLEPSILSARYFAIPVMYFKNSKTKQTSAVTLHSVRAYFISTVDHRGRFIPLPTLTPKSKHDNIHRPHIHFWLVPVSQAYIHTVTAHFKGDRFAIHFQRYRALPANSSLNIRGNIVILRMGKQNPLNPVNMKVGKHSDAKKARAIAKK